MCFRDFVLQNFPFLEDDFDALTDYELFCKMVEYMRKALEDVDSFQTQLTAFNQQLETYENYFNNLDVQEEINKKLDEMAQDGTLTNLIKDYVDPIYEAYEERINNSISSFETSTNSSIASMRSQLNSVASGSPAGVYDTVEDLETADPIHSKIYLVSADGKWYYYDTSLTSWTAGGTYQATAVDDNTITPKKTTFLTPITHNMLQLDDLTYTNNDVTAVCKDGVITITGTATGSGYIRITLTQNITMNGWYNFTCFNTDEVVSGQKVGFIDTSNNYIDFGNLNINEKNVYHKPTNSFKTFYMKFTSGDVINTVLKPMLTNYDVDNSVFYAYNDYAETKGNFQNKNGSILPAQTSFANRIGANILDPSKLWDNVYANNSPTNHFTNSNETYCIYLIHLEQGDKIRCYPRIRNYLQADGTTYITKVDDLSGNPYVITADQDSDFYITFYKADTNKMITVGDDAVDYVPFKRMLSEEYGLNSHQISEINNAVNVSNELIGKKYASLGDSFTHGDFSNAESDNYHITSGPYTGEYKVYPYLIGNKNNMDVTNLAVNGMTLTNINGVSENYLSTDVLSNIPDDVDYITIKIGINDNPDHQNAPLGTINDNTDTTFYGSFNIVMNYLISNYPNAHIGILVSNGMTSNDFINATINIAKKYGVAYLNETTDYSIPYLIRAKRDDMSSSIKSYRDSQYAVLYGTNNHPNAQCHELEAIIVENWMKGI